jgi:hypothetical protein
MFAAKMDAEKIFRFISIAILDEAKLQEIVDQKSMHHMDQLFVLKRETFLKRIKT